MDEEYIIYNPTLGVRDFVVIGETKTNSDKTSAWLDDPYDMVGPFDLDELRDTGQISFAACLVMSRKKWQEDRIFLQQQAFKKQQKAQKEHFEEIKKHNAKKGQHTDTKCRKLLSLPIHGELEATQIKSAYRKVIKTAHPDLGGSHEKFIEITKARDTLLEILL